MIVYLDNQATTRCDPRVLDAMWPWFSEHFGNPHSAEHAAGRAAEATVETARAQVAALIGANPREIVFTSGATEANNLAIKGAARHALATGDARRRIITVATEHSCVLGAVADLAHDGFFPVVLPVRPDGLLDPAVLRAALAEAPSLLVSVMMVNNETGVVQDIVALAEIAHEAGALFHTDAAQALGKIAVDVASLGADLLSVSGHKVYGPKGVGALFVRRRPRARIAPLFSGGGQERGMRSGTVPVPLVVGFGAACAIAGGHMAEDHDRIVRLRVRLMDRLAATIPGIRLNGSVHARVAENLNVTLPHARVADVLGANAWLCVSSGSACSSAEVAPSHVLSAMGVTHDEARRTLRIGIGRFTSAAEIDRATDALAASDACAAAETPLARSA